LDYGVFNENIIEDVGSGRSLKDRPNLKAFLDNYKKLDEKDLVKIKTFNLQEKKAFVVCYLDRVSRDFDGGLSILQELERQGISFIPLDMEMISTANPETRKFIISIMISLAEYQITSLKKRQAAGILEAKRLNKYNQPRKKTVLTQDTINLVKQKLERKLTNQEIYVSIKISKSSFYLAKKTINQNNLKEEKEKEKEITLNEQKEQKERKEDKLP
jgi:DNA invertase Pin-like site-specific DNA recombinase